MTKEQLSILDDLLEVESGLSARDMDFIEDLDRRWRDRDLSEKQLEWLLNLSEKIL